MPCDQIYIKETSRHLTVTELPQGIVFLPFIGLE